MYGDSLHISACLALGKVGGKDAEGNDAEGLRKGDVSVWEKGEKQKFGDADTMYIGFRVEESSA